MTAGILEALFPGIEPGRIPLLPLLDDYHQGVLITDAHGVVRYMNAFQARIDDLSAAEAVGRRVTDLYRVDEGTSPTMNCLRSGRPVVNLACFYRTHRGRVVNSIHNVYPLVAGGRIVGTLCVITDYNPIDGSVPAAGSGAAAGRRATAGDRFQVRENGTRYTFDDIVGRDPDLLAAVKTARMAATSPSAVMVYGETGTGKEMIAQSIHNAGPRSHAPYVAINCAAIPENLLEGMLLGTARGAFTGAVDKAGLLEAADRGTLFLDEVNAMPPSLQVKLLRVLQERRVRRVGAMREIGVDLKVISSVNVRPHEAIESGSLRPDLFYRLAVVFIDIPPLRERMDDLDRLIDHFLKRSGVHLDKRVEGITPAVSEHFQRCRWPGNVRELAHVIEGAMNMVDEGGRIGREHLLVPLSSKSITGSLEARADADGADEAAGPLPARGSSLPTERRRNERSLITAALRQTGGNAARAARRLGISPQLMHYKLKRLGIDRRRFRGDG